MLHPSGSPVDVAIVGAGISGLAAAYELHKRGLTAVLLERSHRAGGVILTEHVDEFVIDAGPDSLLVQKPAAVALCHELGIGDRLFPTRPPRTAYVLRGGRLFPLPEASILGFPTRLGPLLTSGLFSFAAKARMAAEVMIPPLRDAGDESIASFVRRRFGSEAVTYIAEPLLAGIHAGDVERLSMRALFPRLVDAEAASGSVIRSLRRSRGRGTGDGAFRSLPGGIGELVDAVRQALPASFLHYDCRVTGVRAPDASGGFTLDVHEQPAVRANAVILACPAYSIAHLVRDVDAALAAACGRIQYKSTATAVFAYPRAAIEHPMEGTGFVVPRVEGLHITAGAWISSKWPHRAPAGQALLRAFLGGARDPDVLGCTDAEMAETARAELTAILGIRGTPTLTRIYRWDRASPQLEVGHLELMGEIDRRLSQQPGLFASTAGLRGTGIPDCIADARASAAAAAQYVLDYTRRRKT